MTIYEKLADLLQCNGENGLFAYEVRKSHGEQEFRMSIIDTRWVVYNSLCEITDFLRANYPDYKLDSYDDTPLDDGLRHAVIHFTI